MPTPPKALKTHIDLSLSYPRCCTDEFIEALRGVGEVVEGHYTDGENDMVFMVVARDPGHLREVLVRLNSLPGVQGTKSTIFLSTPIKRR